MYLHTPTHQRTAHRAPPAHTPPPTLANRMLRSCVCLGRGAKRRSSSLEDTSSCRSSEIERVAKRMETMTVYTKTTATTKTTTTTTTTKLQNQQQQQLLQQSNDSGRSTTSSLLQFFQSKTWYRHWRKTERSMSMSKTERSESYFATIYTNYKQIFTKQTKKKKKCSEICEWMNELS